MMQCSSASITSLNFSRIFMVLRLQAEVVQTFLRLYNEWESCIERKGPLQRCLPSLSVMPRRMKSMADSGSFIPPYDMKDNYLMAGIYILPLFYTLSFCCRSIKPLTKSCIMIFFVSDMGWNIIPGLKEGNIDEFAATLSLVLTFLSLQRILNKFKKIIEINMHVTFVISNAS